MSITEKETVEDEITLREVIINLHKALYYLFKKWPIIVSAAALGAIIGIYKTSQKNTIYTAECTFVMESGSPSAASSGLASIIGVDLGSTPGLFQNQNILALYKTRLMVEKTLFMPLSKVQPKELLIDRYIKMKKMGKSWASIPDSSKSTYLKNIISDITKTQITIESEDLIKVEVKSEDELYSKIFAETIVDIVNSFYIETKTKKAKDALKILQRQADSLKRVLNISMSSAASAIDANPNANSALQILRVPSQRRQLDVQASSAIYGDVVRNLENTRMSLRKETPIIQIVDRPMLPLDKSAPNMALAVSLWAGILAFITSITLLLVLFYNKIMVLK